MSMQISTSPLGHHWALDASGEAIAARFALPGATLPASCVSTILVGEDNPYGGAIEHALYPAPSRSAGARLRDILGVSDVNYVGTWRANLCSSGAWSMQRAVARARDLMGGPWSSYVLLGAKVRDAFARASDGTLEFCPTEYVEVVRPRDGDGTRYVKLPHPSGRCRLWGIPGMAERARRAVEWL